MELGDPKGICDIDTGSWAGAGVWTVDSNGCFITWELASKADSGSPPEMDLGLFPEILQQVVRHQTFGNAESLTSKGTNFHL